MEQSPELKALDYLFECDDELVPTLWRWYFSEPAHQAGFQRFILSWVSRGWMRAAIDGEDVPMWKLKELLDKPQSAEASRVLLIGTDAGFKEYEYHCGKPRE
jgi:hypothetical protein